MTLHWNNASWKRTNFKFTKPKAVGYFSCAGNRQISFDSTQLKYYRPYTPIDHDIHLDLNHGIHAVLRKLPCDEKIDNILRWIQYKYPDVKSMPNKKKWLHVDFICWRGLLTKIMLTPCNKKEGWIVCAVKWKGTIYLCEFKTAANIHQEANRTEKELTFMSWGFKFEQYLVSDHPKTIPDTSKPVNESEEFGCIFESHLSNKSILYGAEMDGIESSEVLSDPLPLEKLKFIELKTSRIIENLHQNVTLKKFKFPRWWCQSFLVGIENLICGFRDDNGIVRKIESYRVSDLPKMSKEFWNAFDPINFGDYFLNHVAKTVVNDCDKTIYKFEREPYGNIIMTELPPSSEYAFLPEWYTRPDK